jgi:LysM repeat protein
VHVVQPGETMWSIAESQGVRNVSAVVDRMVRANGSATIHVGQELAVPVG